MEITVCHLCGARRSEGRFCSGCGTDLGDPPSSENRLEPQPQEPTPATAHSVGTPPPGSLPATIAGTAPAAVLTPALRSAWVAKMAVVVLIAAVAGGGAWVAATHGSNVGIHSAGPAAFPTVSAPVVAVVSPTASPAVSIAPTTSTVTLVSPVPGSTYKGLIVPTLVFPLDQAHGPTLGSEQAPVTVDVWSDEQCPPCARFWEALPDAFVDDYLRSGKARIVFNDYPVVDQYTGGTRESALAAIGARAADRQGEFWPFIAYLLANQHDENSGWVTQAKLDQIADALDLDVDQFEQDCRDVTITKPVSGSFAAATKRGITAAPQAMLKGSKTVIGKSSLSWDDIAAAIDAAG
jgi:protein-disulfide isomerase